MKRRFSESHVLSIKISYGIPILEFLLSSGVLVKMDSLAAARNK